MPRVVAVTKYECEYTRRRYDSLEAAYLSMAEEMVVNFVLSRKFLAKDMDLQAQYRARKPRVIPRLARYLRWLDECESTELNKKRSELVLTPESAARVLDLLENPRPATPELRKLLEPEK
jgi:hypothetical protein